MNYITITVVHVQTPERELRSQGLCLVPISSTFPVTNQVTVDLSIPTFGEPPDEPKV